MNRDRALVGGLVLAGMLLANGAYAFLLPDVLAAVTPAMPFGYREAASPAGEAGATFVRAAELSFKRYLWSEGDLPYPAVITGGVAAGDVDGDGDADLYFPPGGPGHPAALFVNEGEWRFTDATAAWGLASDGFGAGAAFADADNDGDPDLYALIDGGARLYRNDGARFEDVTEGAGVSLAGLCGARACQPSSLVSLDYDRDGLLDLYVVNNLDWRAPGLHTSGQDYASLIYFAPRQLSVLFRNLGDLRFEDVTERAGVDNTGKGLAAVAADVDGNGYADLATANDITENALYLNRGDGTFEDRARAARVNEVKTSMGIAAGDVDGDGLVDLVVSNFRGQKLSLLLQRADGTFSYETEARGLGASWRGTGWGVALFDYDLDGWLDVAHAVGRAVPLDPHKYDLDNLLFPELVEDHEDQLYRNLGGGRFAEVTYSAGDFAGTGNTRAVLPVDLDGDGDEDLVRVNVQGGAPDLLRNDRASAHGWLQLDLEGTRSNRDGIGAKVSVTLPDGRAIERERLASAGYQTGLPGTLTIGLGEAGEARVRILWPSGLAEGFGSLSTGRHRLVEGAGAP